MVYRRRQVAWKYVRVLGGRRWALSLLDLDTKRWWRLMVIVAIRFVITGLDGLLYKKT